MGLAPFVEALRSSLFHDIRGNVSFAGLENFRTILEDAGFAFSLNITVLWAVANVASSLTLGFLLALVLQRRRHRALHTVLLVPMAIPVYIAIPLWRAFLHGNGGVSVLTRLTGLELNLMVDPLAGFFGSLLVSLWLSLPLTTFVFSGHMRKVSRQVLEAARLEGAGDAAIARYIYLPEIRESLAAMAVLNFIRAFKEFTLVYLMTAGGPPLVQGITDRYIIGATTTLGVFLYEVFLRTPDWGINGAYAVIMSALVLLAILVWVILRRPEPRKGLLALSSAVLISGGTLPFVLVGLGYLIPLLRKRWNRPSALLPLIPHAVLTLFFIVTRGFLGGFHPGILVSAVLLFLPSETTQGGLRRVVEIRFLGRGRPRKPIPLQSGSGPTFPGSVKWHSSARRDATDRFRAPGRCRIPGGFGISGISGSAAALLFTVLTASILYMLIWMSLSRISACYIGGILPGSPTLSNFRLLFTEEKLGRVFLNTFTVATAAALLVIPVVFPAAVFLDGRSRKSVLLFVGGIQILGIAGGMHTLIPLYSVIRRLGLLDSWIPLILIYVYHSIPFSLFVLTAYLDSIPSSFRDLARLEGAGALTYGCRILLPLSLPQILTIVMLTFVSGWNGFQAPLLFLNREELYTISLRLFAYVGSIGSGAPLWNLFAAASVVNSLVVGGIFLRFRTPMTNSPIREYSE